MTIDNNAIEDEGAKALAAMLEHHASLTEVRICTLLFPKIMIAKNYIGNSGAEALAKAAVTNQKMKALYLCTKISYEHLLGNPLVSEATRATIRANKRPNLEMYPYSMSNLPIVTNCYLSGRCC